MRLLFIAVLSALIMALLSTNDVFAEQGTEAEPATQSIQAKAYRLALEASPYLRQHANNPVEWYPWGEEAFERARKENKPIFLSVGYSTCYWCHVMKRESFENDAVAKLLNDSVIAIKVDRERRPDVDETYMIATELIAKTGGWPNSVFLTPDLKPFFALTYAPADQFMTLVAQISSTWKQQEAALRADGERVASLIAQINRRSETAVEITPKMMTRASLAMLSGFDVFNGGIGTAPKFPREQVLLFLYQRAVRHSDATAHEAFLLTLDNIILGGIHDHVGGGFHRYAVDNAWAVPHFEKMLYNQAVIGRLLINAYELTGRRRYGDAARKTFNFVVEQMATEEGAFASAFDAETDGKEGLYYLWSKVDFDAALGDDADFGAKVFGISEEGNHEGLNTLRFVAPIEELDEASGFEKSDFIAKVRGLLERLRKARKARPKLLRDDKVIADWNAAMVQTLADASTVLSESRYLEAAERAMTLLIDKLGAGTADMQRSYFEGITGLAATQADHAGTGLAALALYDATGKERWLQLAKSSAHVMSKQFLDGEAGDFFLTASATGFVRTKQYDDGDLQGGNGAALQLFGMLALRDPDPSWRHAADRLADALSGLVQRSPMAMAGSLSALDNYVNGPVTSRQTLAKGALRVSTKRIGEGGETGLVVLDLAPGWHINSNAPNEDFLIPTKLTIGGREPDGIKYPKASSRKLGFHDRTLELFEGRTELTFKLPESKNFDAPQRLMLSLQACSDTLCLEPESIELLVPARSAE